jgi:hypothetical protein
VIPEHPHDAGTPELHADRAHKEGARLLTDEAMDTLEPLGFTRVEIEEWAETYLTVEGSGDLETFLTWIKEREKP